LKAHCSVTTCCGGGLFQGLPFTTMPSAIQHLKKDPVLGAIIRRVGPMKMQYREPSFETLVRSIVYQQLSGKVASVIFGRLHAAAGQEKLTPEGILKLRTDRMR